MNRTLLLMVLLAPAAACASAQAKAPADRPNLEVPAPPARIIEPLPIDMPALEPVGDLPAPPGVSRPRAPASREPAREPAKPEPKPDAQPEPPPAPQLRTQAVPDGPAASRQIREILDRADRLLRSTDYRALSTERKKSYDTAKDFMREGEDALKAANYVYAKELADKAERLAKELQGR